MGKNRIQTNQSFIKYLLSILNNGQYIFYMSFIERLLYFLFFVVLARSLETLQYGIIISIFAFANITNMFFNFGLPIHFQRLTAKSKNKMREQFFSGLIIKILGLFLFIIISLIYYNFSSFNHSNIYILIVIPIYIFGINSFLQHIFFGDNNFNKVFKPFIIARVIFVTHLSLFYFKFISHEVLFFGFFAISVLELILLAKSLYNEKIHFFMKVIDINEIKDILKSSTPIGFGLFCVMMYDKIDILLIEKILNFELVSYYAVAYSIYKIPQIISSSILVPFFSDLSSKNADNSYMEKIKEIALTLLAISLLIIIIIYFVGDFIVAITFGEKYLSSSYFLKILSIALPFLFLNNLTGVVLNSVGLEKKAFKSAAIASFINILLNIVLLNLWGIIGAIISTIVTEFIILLIQLFYINQKREILI
ncbi:MAG: oligosaccharide flippase family protein [Melioribacteraceae bacterium]|nr:oligosaccharide flippase family protein [Melioribacteraceae bacterium]